MLRILKKKKKSIKLFTRMYPIILGNIYEEHPSALSPRSVNGTQKYDCKIKNINMNYFTDKVVFIYTFAHIFLFFEVSVKNNSSNDIEIDLLVTYFNFIYINFIILLTKR